MTHENHVPGRVRGRFFTSGTFGLLALMGLGYSFGLARFITGLDAVTNLDDAHPWGLWIAIDVACGVALAAGGFTTAALVEIFGRKRFHALLRPAILTAWLGYAMVGFALLFDLGRYWNIWRPMINWQGNSVLFEVGMCVMTYLLVLTVEMSASFLDGAREWTNAGGAVARWLQRIAAPLEVARRVLRTALPLFIIAGVVLSCMHQSSLGALLLIAPTKMSPLWYTVVLPLLFLLSAFMVGFPMVILESIVASRALGREPEMHLLGPLAARIPYLIGIYLVLKIGDLAVRRPSLTFPDDAGQLTSLLVELSLGVIAPLILFSLKAVRRSPGWLLVSALLVIGGVVLNRVNVFIVAFEPPFTDRSYFPSFGEISLTLGMIATIAFLYRVFVFLFPILGGEEPAARAESDIDRRPAYEPLDARVAWGVRGVGAALLLVFVGAYGFVHREAVSGEIRATRWVQRVTPIAEQAAAEAAVLGHPDRPEGYRRVYMLNASVLNARTDFYEPARFTHISHDEWTGGDCSVCHHRVSYSEDDRVGDDLREFHAAFDVKIGGACAQCHDMESLTIQRCSACHGDPTESDAPSRVGLKGAYHRQCIGCHESAQVTAPAPTDCVGCHHPRTPNHATLLDGAELASAVDVTERCLTCHETDGQEILLTAHWRWSGHSPGVFGHEESGDLGLRTLASSHVLGVAADVAYCATCHIGLGDGPEGTYARPSETIDCLVCHDTTGTYAKAVGQGGAPAEGIDLVHAAASVGRPSRERCGSCHFHSDGGPNLKHGDLEPALADPPDEVDVHMGRYDLLCQDCHKTRDHRIAGMSVTAPAVEGRVLCTDCHGESPHGIAGPQSWHLDEHVRSIACETCHVPQIARIDATRTFADYRRMAELGAADSVNALERPRFADDSGAERWEKNLVPTYTWYNGTREAVLVGQAVDASETVVLNRPHGTQNDPRSLITPFKMHRAVQPIDAKSGVLAVADLHGGFWTDFDMAKAVEAGMKAAGLEYSGELGWAETVLYTGIHHEVVPSQAALACADCHARELVRCSSCHREPGARDYEHLIGPIDPAHAPRLDFEALGYSADPIRAGGRFHHALTRGTP